MKLTLKRIKKLLLVFVVVDLFIMNVEWTYMDPTWTMLDFMNFVVVLICIFPSIVMDEINKSPEVKSNLKSK